jgi:hypothetical protein
MASKRRRRGEKDQEQATERKIILEFWGCRRQWGVVVRVGGPSVIIVIVVCCMSHAVTTSDCLFVFRCCFVIIGDARDGGTSRIDNVGSTFDHQTGLWEMVSPDCFPKLLDT